MKKVVLPDPEKSAGSHRDSSVIDLAVRSVCRSCGKITPTGRMSE